MDLIREYWWAIVVLVVLVLAFVVLRPRQRVQLTDSAPVRPHMVSCSSCYAGLERLPCRAGDPAGVAAHLVGAAPARHAPRGVP